MIRFKWLMSVAVIVFFAGFLRLLWPIKIIGIHHVSDRDTFDLIIKYPPITDNSKIQWRENNKLFFEEKHHPPVGKRDYINTFWVADYKIDSGTDQDSDLMCFDDMKSKANCIENG